MLFIIRTTWLLILRILMPKLIQAMPLFKATGSPRDTFSTMTDVFSYWSSCIFHTIFAYVFEQNQTYLEISFSSTQMHLYSPSLHRSRMTLYLRRFIRLINFYNRILALPPESLISKIYSSRFYNQQFKYYCRSVMD